MDSAKVNVAGLRKDRMYIRCQDERRRHSKNISKKYGERGILATDPKKGECQRPRDGGDRENSMRNLRLSR